MTPSSPLRSGSTGMRLITAEYTAFDQLIKPDVTQLFVDGRAALCLCVRPHWLRHHGASSQRSGDYNETRDPNAYGIGLDRVLETYRDAGVPVVCWPLLPPKEGLYLNRRSAGEFERALERLFAWCDARDHPLETVLVDIEPATLPGQHFLSRARVRQMLEDLDHRTFEAAIPRFERIVALLRSHGTRAMAATVPFVAQDHATGRRGWQDLAGGPILAVDWDQVFVMVYPSWFVQTGRLLGVGWDAAHQLTFQYAREVKRIWGARAVVGVGVTHPGEGQESVIYETPTQLAPAIAAVRAAGVEEIAVYDLEGMLGSPDPRAWFEVLSQTAAARPVGGLRAARRYRRVMAGAGWTLDWLGRHPDTLGPIGGRILHASRYLASAMLPRCIS